MVSAMDCVAPAVWLNLIYKSNVITVLKRRRKYTNVFKNGGVFMLLVVPRASLTCSHSLDVVRPLKKSYSLM